MADSPPNASVPHPILLGLDAAHLCLWAAVSYTAMVRRPSDFLSGLADLREDGLPQGLARELGHAATWLVAKCAEPGGLACAYQDPKMGALQRLPSTAVWQASKRPPILRDLKAAPLALEELAPFQFAAIMELGLPDCQPEIEIVVRNDQLVALLEADAQVAALWFGLHEREVRERLGRLRTRIDSGEQLLFPVEMLESFELRLRVLDEARAAVATSTTEARPAPFAHVRAGTTKETVANMESEYRRRWVAREFENPKTAREALCRELNTRVDGSVAQSDEAGYIPLPTIERNTRGWFE